MFRFDVIVNDQDYLDFHKFWLTRSLYGKEQMRSSRIVVALIFVVSILLLLFVDNFSVTAFLDTIPLLIALIVMQIVLVKILCLSLKRQIKSLKKSGRMGYSPNSILEFLEDSFIERTPDNKTEHKYSAIERVSIVDNKMIYIHVNNVMSYMLPLSCFDSKEKYNDFFNFIKTKCEIIDIY